MREILPTIQRGLPPTVKAQVVYNSTRFIQSSIDEVTRTLIEAVGIVIVVIFLFLGSTAFAGSAPAQTIASPGITEPIILPPFNRSAKSCTPPVGLQRQLTFSQDNDRQFMQGVRFGLEQAAKKRGLAFSVDLANNDATKMAASVDAAVKAHVGAIIASPVDAIGLAPSFQSAINAGTYVGTVVPPPAVTILNAPQYLTGERLALAASEYIVKELDSKANVVLLPTRACSPFATIQGNARRAGQIAWCNHCRGHFSRNGRC